MGTDDLFKKTKKIKEIRTSLCKLNKLDTILILCEGEKTEPNYFNGFIVDYRLRNVTIRGLGLNTDAIAKIALKERSNYSQIWCVFDRDSFPSGNFCRAFQMTEKHKNIKIAYSNEAFELWYLLHFNYYDSSLSRKQYGDKLSALLGNKYEKNSKNMYNILKSKQSCAINNAKNLLNTYAINKPETNNPSTTVHLLVEELNKFKND